MTREEKQQVVEEIKELVDGSTGFFSIDFTGLNVTDTIALREEFSAAGVNYRVAKNTLVRRALQDAGGYDDVTQRLVGQTGIALGYDDPAAPARVLKKFLDDRRSEVPAMNFAFIEGVVYDGDQLKAVAAMPSRQDVLAGIVGSLHAPVSGIVGAINGVMRDLASVIEEVAKSRETAEA